MRAATQLSDISSQTGGTSDTHARQQESRIIVLSCWFWIIFFQTFCCWRFYSSPCCIILPPDEKQEYPQSVEEQRLRDAVHKVRSPESSTAFLLMRAGLAHPLHCSTVSSASAHLLCKDQGERRRRFCGESRWMWRVAGEQEQAGGGRGGRASRGWEPTSPWSKDRPPVPLKNTCEFDLTCVPAQCSEL